MVLKARTVFSHVQIRVQKLNMDPDPTGNKPGTGSYILQGRLDPYQPGMKNRILIRTPIKPDPTVVKTRNGCDTRNKRIRNPDQIKTRNPDP